MELAAIRNAPPVGSRSQHGNASECVEEPWHGDYRGGPPTASTWIEGRDANRRVVRGGSWHTKPDWLSLSLGQYRRQPVVVDAPHWLDRELKRASNAC